MIFRVSHRPGRPAGSAEDGEGATRGANSPVSVVGHGNRPDLHGAPHPNWGGSGHQVTVAFSSMPTTCRSGPAASDAPKLAADSASNADTPPWRMP